MSIDEVSSLTEEEIARFDIYSREGLIGLILEARRLAEGWRDFVRDRGGLEHGRPRRAKRIAVGGGEMNWTQFFIAWSIMATVLAIREAVWSAIYKKRYEAERMGRLQLIFDMKQATKEMAEAMMERR